jgi:cobalt/nickel transport system permease protein
VGHLLSNGEKTLSRTGATQGTGMLGRIDPRARILAALVFGVTVVALSDLTALACAFAISALLLFLSRLPIRRTLKRVAMMDSFIIFMLVMLPFTMPGDPIFTLWGFPASWQGFWRAVEIGLTANAVVLALMTLVGTLEPVTLGHALHALRLPETLVHLMMFTIRYIEVLRDEYLRLRTSMRVRGFRPGTNWHTYRSFGYLLGMMLVRALERSERILDAMKCRGFQGRFILLDSFSYGRRDLGFAFCITFALLALIAVELRHVAY